MTPTDSAIADCMLELIGRRAPSASICPSDVARAITREADDWRALMPTVRRVAARLARDGMVSITQGGDTLRPDRIDHGPIRLRRGPAFSAPE